MTLGRSSIPIGFVLGLTLAPVAGAAAVPSADVPGGSSGWSAGDYHVIRTHLGTEAIRLAKDGGHVRSGELVAVLAGSDSRSQATNVLRIERVP